MITLLFVIHVIISALLVVAVLLQSSKGGGLAAGLGGGMANNLLGSRGTATFLSKATTFLAAAFMVSCIGLTLVYNKFELAGSGSGSSVQDLIQRQSQLPAAEQQVQPVTQDTNLTNPQSETAPQETPPAENPEN